jgi:hypothetical protein
MQILDSAKKGNVKMLSSMFEFMFVCRDYVINIDNKAFGSILLNQGSRVGSAAFSVPFWRHTFACCFLGVVNFV